ncbi:MAG: hypothetical protein PHZ07_00735 [Patescibacteria group bacterium]|nr:hypothetical protein [Patescibacteria group bacterium]MDD4304795.1 hypothetical protein [Patescibacteria group bacterium]MDD4695522.1 hypothetical protein [Patescibacteria group bacterium]
MKTISIFTPDLGSMDISKMEPWQLVIFLTWFFGLVIYCIVIYLKKKTPPNNKNGRVQNNGSHDSLFDENETNSKYSFLEFLKRTKHMS